MLLEEDFGLSALVDRARQTLRADSNNFRIGASKEGSLFSVQHLSNCVAIAFCCVEKVGLVIGGIGGQGIVLSKFNRGTPEERWSAPCPICIGGASIGVQMGATEVNYFLLFMTHEAFDDFLKRESTQMISLSGSASFGDYGSETAALSNLKKGALVVGTAEGFFAGITFSGEHVTIDHTLLRKSYGETVTPQQLLVEGLFAERISRTTAGHALYKDLDEFDNKNLAQADTKNQCQSDNKNETQAEK